MSRILAIDFGLKRIGLAISDELHYAISPIQSLQYDNSNFWELLLENISNNKIGTIVIGIPYKEGEDHILRIPIENFYVQLSTQLLTHHLSIPIYFQDESNSSEDAMKLMIKIGKKKKQRSKKGIIDSFSAAIILRDFLENY